MRLRLALAAVLLLSGSWSPSARPAQTPGIVRAAATGALTLGWTRNPALTASDGYFTLRWPAGERTPIVTDVGDVDTVPIVDQEGDQYAVVAYQTWPQTATKITVSYPSARVAVPPVAVIDPARCLVPFGADAIGMTITSADRINAKVGARVNVRFQLASRSPITKIIAKLDGQDVGQPVTGTDAGALWFDAPAPGTYRLTLSAANAYGCVRDSTGVRSVVVP